ncbi:MAG: hypothetical protein MN733_02305 [Nitrososphaera sp.]|nr:hypothetical protein [Nitrososphaera sp.]
MKLDYVKEQCAKVRERCARIAEETAKTCAPSNFRTKELLPWNEHSSHSSAHDNCHESLSIAAKIRAMDIEIDEE